VPAPDVVQIDIEASARPFGMVAQALRGLTGAVRIVLVRLVGDDTRADIEDDAHVRAALAELARPDLSSIAVVTGGVAGPATALALGCDLRIFLSGATLRLGAGALGGLGQLVGTVGYPRAFELCVTGRPVGADEAKAIGLANLVASGDDAEAAVAALVAALLATPRDDVIELKAALLACRDVISRDRRAAAELDAAARLTSSEPI
jgi:enoyl-CoA hydratase/carnithine racemase